MHTGSSQAATVLGSPCYLASGGRGWGAVAQTLLFAGLAGAPGRGQITPATSEDRTPSPSPGQSSGRPRQARPRLLPGASL